MQKIKVGKKIADGAFGSVYQATETIQGTYPTKIVVKQAYPDPNNIRQMSIVRSLNPHPNIISTYDCIQQKFLSHIVMQRGLFDLHTYCCSISYPIQEEVVQSIALQTLAALSSLHNQRILHRDIKPTNLLIKDHNTIAVCDFGSATTITKEYAIEGFTKWYKCPEIIFGAKTYGWEVDIWSLGCVLMQVASGEPFFAGNSQIEQLSLIAHVLGDPSPKNWKGVTRMPDFGKIRFDQMPKVSPQQIARERGITVEMCRFIMRMVAYEDRPTADQLLTDQYLTNIKNKQVVFKQDQGYLMRKKLLQKKKK